MRLFHLIAASLLITSSAACGKKADAPPAPVEEAKKDEPKADDKKPEDKPAEPKPGETPTEVKPEEKPADPTAGWVDYKGPDDSYTAKFPGTPTESTEDMPVEGTKQTMKSALYEAAGGSKAFITALVDITVPAGSVYDAQKGIDGAVDGMLNGMSATRDTVTNIKWGAIEGREVTYHGTSEGVSFTGIARVYASGGDKPRLYQANTIATSGAITAEMRTFLDNFALNASKDAVAEVKPVDPSEVKPVEAPANGEWLSHETALYTVELPSKPTETKSQLPTPIGEREMVMYASVTGTGGFMVGSVDMQVPAGTAFDVKAAMEGARDGILKSVGGDPTKAETKDVETAGLKGQEISFVADQKLEGKEIGGRVRMFIDEAGGKKLYALVAIGTTPLDEAGIKTFFESFAPKK